MKQTTKAKKGEISFRKKLCEQQVLKQSVYFDDEFSVDEIETIINRRMAKTFDQIADLKSKGISVSPYLEIGAARGHRALVLENELGCEGAATDISFYSLKSCVYYQALFRRQRMPLRICCDANQLPFMPDSVPFVFCYETLHHFPDPTPILEQVYRILAPGGCFFFDEEPFQQKMHIPLKKMSSLYSKNARQRNRLLRALDYLFSVRSCNEIEYGIIENHKISIKQWEDSLRVFDKHTAGIVSIGSLSTNLLESRRSIKRSLCDLLGGTISATCFKDITKESTINHQGVSIKDVIVCPDCLHDGKEVKLLWNDEEIRCPQCASIYRFFDDILLLFPRHLLVELYPEFAK